MSGKIRNKVPKAFTAPAESKTPKAGVFPTERCQPEFKAEQIDRDGPWGWDCFDPSHLQEVFQKIFESQKLTWQDLRNNGSHLVLYSVSKNRGSVRASSKLFKRFGMSE